VNKSDRAERGLFLPARPFSIGTMINVLMDWGDRARERRQLDGLGDHMLKDLGVSRVEVEREVNKPFWRR
jgi:uncharacterized protein YjiS (DUF1127 family)